tara:strand:- start:57908 stop:60556 length:2649 start_codon:yes stop_codon:yes gene_type:complete
MKSSTNQPQTIYLKHYQEPNFFIESTELNFQLFADKTVVHSRLKIVKNTSKSENNGDLILAGEELKLLSIKVDGQELTENSYECSDKSLTIANLDNAFTLEIKTEIYPDKNTALSGLYKSDGMFCTQCEAEGFRRITYYLDRPDVMSIFSTTIEADKKTFPVLLSNGNLVDKGDKGDRHWVRWDDPFKKPAYLFALVAGDLTEIKDHYVTQSGRKVTLAIFVEAENAKKCDHAMQSLKNSMQWDEQKYGLEYDLDIYMIVAVNNFNMGAMENKGLNIFNSKYVLADEATATDSDFQGVEMVIGHEYFHNWTGNRVTLRDWFQLSLKEGLTVFREQQFTADMGTPVVNRIADVKQIRTRQYAEDSGPIAHPVRPDSYIEINNFYTMTIYYKGSEVIRMLHTLLGESGFRAGMDLYFERYDGQAVTIEHFISAMSDANKTDLAQFMHWYHQAGTPVVNVTKNFDESTQTLTFDFTQSCPKTPGQEQKKPFVIPIKIALYDKEGNLYPIAKHTDIKQTESGTFFVLDKKSTSLTITGVNKPLVPSFLGNYSAPVKLHMDYTAAESALIIKHDQDSFNRWDKCQDYKCALVTKMMTEFETQPTPTLPAAFLDLYKDLLKDMATDPALLAELLALPSFHYIAEQLEQVNVKALNGCLIYLRDTLAKKFSKDFFAIYKRMSEQDTGKIEATSISARALKNTALAFLGRSQEESYAPLIENQYQNANNMTDRMGALSAINHWSHPIRERLFNQFYEDFKHETLVLDKWFSLQAQAELPDTLDRVSKLLSHEAFDLKNPNKIYALIRTFGAANAQCFHSADGKGYEFIADRVIDLNQQNPQVAARVLETLTGWKRLDKTHAQLMKKTLLKIQQVDNLSEDVYEIVNKSLV